MDESELEQTVPASWPTVAIDKKHAFQTVVVPSPVSEASPTSRVVVSKARREKINSLEQKEENLSKAGITRYKYMLRIAEALEATIKVEYRAKTNSRATRKKTSRARATKINKPNSRKPARP